MRNLKLLFVVTLSILFSQVASPVSASSTSFLVNGSPVSGSINYTYSMTGGNVYAFDFTGSSWGTVKLKLYGGGGGATANAGGAGGYVEGILNVSTTKVFWVVVGGAGTSTYSGTAAPVSGGYYTTAGFNGGGRGVSNRITGGDTGGGGGATDVRLSYTTVTDYANANRILVAGGGGGSTSNGACRGGAAGYPNGSGEVPCGYGSSTGGTQSAGGSLNGAFGLGGENTLNTGWNGGGGGGWYGGGAETTEHGGGAGGSSYYNSSYISSWAYTNGGGGASGVAGSAQLIIQTSSYSGPGTISLSAPSISKNKISNVVATLNTPGTVTFYANGRPIPHCKSITTLTNTIICPWRPITTGNVVLSAYFVPSDGTYDPARSQSLSLTSSNRQSAR
jgi:Glycine rich protein